MTSPYGNLDERQAKDCLFQTGNANFFASLRISFLPSFAYCKGLLIPSSLTALNPGR